MTLDEYRVRITVLDDLIKREKNKDNILTLITESIVLNEEYIKKLKKGLAGKVVGLILLIIVAFGIFFIPPIIIRKTKINYCKERIKKLNVLKEYIESPNMINHEYQNDFHEYEIFTTAQY